jgi:FtsZ-interacting cell division protein ZipA
VSASWLQLIGAIAIMYLVVATAGYWGKRKRAQQGAQDNRHDH